MCLVPSGEPGPASAGPTVHHRELRLEESRHFKPLLMREKSGAPVQSGQGTETEPRERTGIPWRGRQGTEKQGWKTRL